MSAQTEMIHELVRSFNERAQIDVARYFAPEFELDQAGAGTSRSGLAGAQDMINALYGLGADVRIEILDMVEEWERVAVRWRIKSDGPQGFVGASLSMYRFVDGRIAEDWGLLVRSDWHR